MKWNIDMFKKRKKIVYFVKYSLSVHSIQYHKHNLITDVLLVVKKNNKNGKTVKTLIKMKINEWNIFKKLLYSSIQYLNDAESDKNTQKWTNI